MASNGRKTISASRKIKMSVLPLSQTRSNEVKGTHKNFIYDDDVVKYGLNMVKTEIYGHRWPH